MLIYITAALAVLCAALGFACYKFFKVWIDNDRWAGRNEARHREEIEEIQGERKSAFDILRHCHQQTGLAIAHIANEIERVTGHSDEAALLEMLVADVNRSPWPMDALSESSIDRLRDAHVLVPDRRMNIGDVLEIALAIDDRARNVERELHSVTRLCLIDRGEGQKAWLADMLSRLERLHGNAQLARVELRRVLDAWEATDDARFATLIT